MNDLHCATPDEDVQDKPTSLPIAEGHGIVAERLFSINGLISLLLLCSGAIALWRPERMRKCWIALGKRFSLLVGYTKPSE